MSGAWRQMDVLLTCDMCHKHFRNPKQLPCQHTYCMDPCLEKLVANSQIKCPECGTDFRVPFQGVGSFPNNVTLVRFLELRQSVRGKDPEPPPTMLQCSVCKEKGSHEKCSHCDKKVCADCKKAHSKILRQELSLICEEVKNGITHLKEILAQTKRNSEKLEENYKAVKGEIEEMSNSYTRDILQTEKKLKYELDLYLNIELKNMNNLKKGLEVEVVNMNSNSELVEKYMNETVPWTDKELVEYKDMFQKTLEFLRFFDSDPSDFARRVRFHSRADPEVVHKTLIEFAEVSVNQSLSPSPEPIINQSNPNIPRSQSDHRLIAQFQRQQGDKDVHGSRKFGNFDNEAPEKEVRFALDDSAHSWKKDQDQDGAGFHRTKFGLNLIDEDGGESDTGISKKPFKFEEYAQPQLKKVTETEDATKGPLSGVFKMADSPKVMERLYENEIKVKMEQQEAERKAKEPPPTQPPPPQVQRTVNRQVSEDEIDKQKKENKAAAATAAKEEVAQALPTLPPVVETVRSVYETPSYRTSPRTYEVEPRTEEPAEVPSRIASRNWRTELETPDPSKEKPPVAPRNTNTQVAKPTKSALSRNSSVDQEDRTKKEDNKSGPSARRVTYLSRTGSLERPEPEKPSEGFKPTHSFSSRFLDKIRARKEEEERERESSDTSSESSDSDSDDNTNDSSTNRNKDDISPAVNALLARSAQARLDSARSHSLIPGNRDENKRPSRSWRDNIYKEDDATTNRTKSKDSGESTALSRYGEKRRSLLDRENSPDRSDRNSRYRSTVPRSKSTHEVADDSAEEDRSTSPYYKSRYDRASDRPQSKYKSSREETAEETTKPWSQYLKNKYGNRNGTKTRNHTDSDNSSDDEDSSRHSTREFSFPRRTYIQKGKCALKFGTRGSEPGCFTWPRGVASGPDNTIVVADSSNHRVQVFTSSGKFLNEFGTYGSGEGQFDCLAAVTVNRIGQYIVSDRYNHRIQVFDGQGRFVRMFGSEGRLDAKFNYPWGLATDSLGFIYICDKENHRIQVFQSDGVFVSKFGLVGSRPGQFEHPHYVAVSSTNRVIVSDSNNHRIQIFDVNGRLLSTFGTEGSDEGQFKFPRGIAVDDQGFIIVGDSGNNRIQIFHPDGTFLKAFGCWGPGEGEFKGLEGVAVTPNGQILVCDRENHRIQVF